MAYCGDFRGGKRQRAFLMIPSICLVKCLVTFWFECNDFVNLFVKKAKGNYVGMQYSHNCRSSCVPFPLSFFVSLIWNVETIISAENCRCCLQKTLEIQ